ncbi:MAG: hypothetical protein HLUCCA11_11120 [Phormidesmis priestleyi Ana]|uniref:YHS domain n=1 Tax=Phormidesmis priestleyi Ana TaxID=1666911 RepID=A0A0P7ZXN6_9CYAN|nr:MAG: hypothetical protein HLUCCA11_11120 [Phormidesmis priestleyi Ana]
MNNQSRLFFVSGHFSTAFSTTFSTTFSKLFAHTRLAIPLVLALGLAACGPTKIADSAANESVAVSETTTVEETAKETAKETASETIADPIADKIYVEDGIAIGGADPVAYFSGEVAAGEFVAGSPDYTYEWKGATWQFANAENRDQFAANPAQYAPEYGGFCAWAIAQNNIAKIDPTAWSIVNDRLYLNYDERIQARWQKDVPGNIAKADANWPELSMQ